MGGAADRIPAESWLSFWEAFSVCRSSIRGLSLFLGALLLSERSEGLGKGGSQVEPPYIWGTVYIQSRETGNRNTNFGRKCFIVGRQAVAVSAKYIAVNTFKYKINKFYVILHESPSRALV